MIASTNVSSIRQHFPHVGMSLAIALLVAGCADKPATRRPPPAEVAPGHSSAVSLPLDEAHIPAMYRRVLAIDLATVMRVAEANNLDIQQAKQRIAASRGVYQSSIWAAFPTIAPGIQDVGLEGAIAHGNGYGLTTFHHIGPAVLVQWMLNPGQMIYDIVASKRRLEAATQQELSTEMDITYRAANQYYDLVVCQLDIAAARQSLQQAQELLRIARLQVRTGTGLPADELRAESSVSTAQQAWLTRLNAFYKASVTLATTLHLDATVMLAPQADQVAQLTLVRDDLSVETLLAIAARYRPDLEAIRKQWAASRADKGAALLGQLGPQIQTTGTLSPPPPAQDISDTLFRRQRYTISAGFSLSPALFGEIKSATANEKIAGIDAERKLDEVRASVVDAQQAGMTAAKLIPKAKHEVDASDEALRLAQKNLQTGTGLTVDVLQAQSASELAHYHYAAAIIHYNQSQLAMLAALGLFAPTPRGGQDVVAHR